MAWDHLSINRPHLVYIILGGFTSLFMLCSSFIKERMYIGEATVATLCGVIFGPHAANLINPLTWGNTDQITLEFSRIVLVVQCFAVGVELPKYYMEKHWRSVVFLLIPVMTFGWLITSLFIWWMIPALDWLQSLCVAACVTATDPVLASSVVGKGKFAKRVPKHLRDLLSAESGCNDGMAFPFVYLALYLIDFRPDANKVSFNWFVITILYECVFGAIYGFIIGYIGRHGIKWAEKNDLVDRESFLVFYFVLALFCAGSGSILGVDDLLVGFSAGVGFSNDGWFTQKTEESHVSNVIDLLINLAYFVYLGTIIPWQQYNSHELGTTPWRLVVIAIFVILFRRIPIMMALKPFIPDVKTWREALFAGHFGPIGVGAIFVAILARAELETETTTPLATITALNEVNLPLVELVWPIVTFLVISSIIVHGSSIAVFTLGKHINTLTLTMSYTTANEDGPSWMNRLPRIQSQSKSMAKSQESDWDSRDERLPPGELPPVGMPGNFLRRQKDEDQPSGRHSRSSSLIPRRRKKKWDDGLGPGGPISQSAIAPQRRDQRDHSAHTSDKTLTPQESGEADDEKEEHREEGELGEVQHDSEMEEIMHGGEDEEREDQHVSKAEAHPEKTETYQEGNDLITENADGEVLKVERTPQGIREDEHNKHMESELKDDVEHPHKAFGALRKKMGVWRHKDDLDGAQSPNSKPHERKRGPALAYQYGNTIIVEDEDGEVVKKYELPSKKEKNPKPEGEAGPVRQGIQRLGTWSGKGETSKNEGEPSSTKHDRPVRQGIARMGTWTGKDKEKTETPRKAMRKHREEEENKDDHRIRFTIGGAGKRMTKEDFLKELQNMDPKARMEVVESSNAPAAMKDLAKKDASSDSPGTSRLFGAKAAQAATGIKEAKQVGAAMAAKRGAQVDEENEAGAGADVETGSDSRTDSSSEGDDIGPVQRRREAVRRAKEGKVGSKLTKSSSPSNQIPESAAEKRRREQVLKGVENSGVEETPAEKRRREAALAGGDDSDSEDDNTPRVAPVTRRTGIRFAEEPIRGRK